MRMTAAARKNRVVRSAADMWSLRQRSAGAGLRLARRSPGGGARAAGDAGRCSGCGREVGPAQGQPAGVPDHEGAEQQLDDAAPHVLPAVAELHQRQPAAGDGAGRADAGSGRPAPGSASDRVWATDDDSANRRSTSRAARLHADRGDAPGRAGPVRAHPERDEVHRLGRSPAASGRGRTRPSPRRRAGTRGSRTAAPTPPGSAGVTSMSAVVIRCAMPNSGYTRSVSSMTSAEVRVVAGVGPQPLAVPAGAARSPAAGAPSPRTSARRRC